MRVVPTSLIVERFTSKLMGPWSQVRWCENHRIEIMRGLYNMGYAAPQDEYGKFWEILSTKPLLGYYIGRNETMTTDQKLEYILDFIAAYPIIALVTGARGTGKTAFVSWLIDKFHEKHPHFQVFWLNGSPSLPQWITVCHDLKEIPGDAVVVVDEAAINFFARDFMKKESKDLTKQLAISRHKGWKMFFISQLSSTVDKTIFNFSDVLIQKRAPSFIPIEDERGGKEVKEYLETMMPRTKEEFVWFDTDELVKTENFLPEWWCDDISKPFSAITEVEACDLCMELDKKGYDPKKIIDILALKGVDWSADEIEDAIKNYKWVRQGMQAVEREKAKRKVRGAGQKP